MTHLHVCIGSMLVGMVDLACVMSISTVIQLGENMNGTVELSLSFIRPAVGAGTYIDITATVTKKGKAVAFVDCSIIDSKGCKVGSGRVVYAIGSKSARHKRTPTPCSVTLKSAL